MESKQNQGFRDTRGVRARFYARGYCCLLSIFLMGCAAQKFHYGGDLTKAKQTYYIDRYWADTQEELEDKTEGLSMFVPSTVVKWVWTKRMIQWIREGKGPVIAWGLYTFNWKKEDRTVYIVSWRPWTIKHEACHVILHWLEYPDWDTYCEEEYR